MPEYNLNDFLKACEVGDVGIDKGPKDDASSQLGLETESDIRSYVADKGEELVFVNTKPWKNFFEKTGNIILIDGYNFFEKNRKFYLGFVKNMTGKWRIKSLHLDDHEIEYKPFESLKNFKIDKGENDE